jgi:hypothetical protein
MPLFLFRLPWLIAVTLLWPHTAQAEPPARPHRYFRSLAADGFPPPPFAPKI